MKLPPFLHCLKKDILVNCEVYVYMLNVLLSLKTHQIKQNLEGKGGIQLKGITAITLQLLGNRPTNNKYENVLFHQ